MAANQLIQTRINAAIKEEAATVLAAMGLTVSDVVRMLLTKIAHDHALPFEPLAPNATTVAAMREARQGPLETVTIEQLQSMLDATQAKKRNALERLLTIAPALEAAGTPMSEDEIAAELDAVRAERRAKNQAAKDLSANRS
jgi:DNA-damage-inducible protein J